MQTAMYVMKSNYIKCGKRLKKPRLEVFSLKWIASSEAPAKIDTVWKKESKILLSSFSRVKQPFTDNLFLCLFPVPHDNT